FYELGLAKPEWAGPRLDARTAPWGPRIASQKLHTTRLRQEAAAKREREAPLRKREKQLERKIEDLNSELRSLETQLSDSTLYDDSNKKQLTNLLQRQGELKIQLAGLEEAWIEVLDQLQ
ncbi:MAG: hypothetical protein VXX24_06435, partial [Pseudomonadota bacterium]|nr:hypothetical protein [Pseudomonadota bacterium]